MWKKSQICVSRPDPPRTGWNVPICPRVFNPQSPSAVSAGWEPIRPDARYDKVHDLKKCARIEVVYDEVSAKPRNFFFLLFSLPHFWRKSFSGLLSRCSDVKCQWIEICFIFFKITFAFKSLGSKFLNRLKFILYFERLARSPSSLPLSIKVVCTGLTRGRHIVLRFLLHVRVWVRVCVRVWVAHCKT